VISSEELKAGNAKSAIETNASRENQTPLTLYRQMNHRMTTVPVVGEANQYDCSFYLGTGYDEQLH